MSGRSYKFTLEYDGSNFEGWQVQASGRTVQAELEKALFIALRREVKATASGRTDSGVHALGQVVSVESVAGDPEPEKLMGNLNGLLPADCKAWQAEWAPQGFHARYDSASKTYRYQWLNRRAPSPLLAGRAWHQARPLDIEAMREASACLVGEHDYSAFRAAECSAKSPVRRVLAVEIDREGDLLRMDITGEAFLQHMVRNIAGSLTQVGLGRQKPAWMASLLAGKDRTLAGETAPAQGLYLVRVDYGEIPRPGRPTGKKA